MAGSKSAYLEAALLDLALGATAWEPPGQVFIALSTQPFIPSATGSALDEVAAADYARKNFVNTGATWSAANGTAPASKSNAVIFDFGTATNDWGTVQSVYVCDAAAAGNILYGGDLAAPVPVGVGAGFAIPVGQFVVTET